ncbi:MAG: hypothetical protein E7484_03055 [Ruminococcaceae bacterium]|nr:hypothetical protein [Oscillospiraceae bacterium]
MVIYADVLLIINFIVSYFLLLAAAVVSGYTYSRKRIIISAVSGAVSCLYIFAPFETGLLDLAVKLLSLALCSFIAFGVKNKKKFFIQTLVYILLNALLTGIIAAVSLKSSAVYHNNMFFYLDVNPVLLVVISAFIYVILVLTELIADKVSAHKCFKMDIVFKNFQLQNMSAFYDSGFRVKDIVSNKDVIIVSYVKLEKFLPEEVRDSIEKFIMQKYDEVKCMFVPVIFNTLTGEGMLPSMKAEYVRINGKITDNILVAFTASELSENVDAIFGMSLRRRL